LLNSRLTLDASRFDTMARPRLSWAHIPGLVSAANGAAALVRTRIAMKDLLVGSVPDRRWPLHPPPSEREDLERWVRRIAEAYGISYDAFLLNAACFVGHFLPKIDGRPLVAAFFMGDSCRVNDYK